jgi:hypothetical protein
MNKYAKQNVVYTYNKVLFGFKTEGNPVSDFKISLNFKVTNLSEISHSQKNNHYTTPLT